MRAAALDIGSNSVRLLVAEGVDGQLRCVASFGETTRLAEGFAAKGTLGARAVARTVVAAKRMAEEAHRHGVSRIRAVATGVVRAGTNADSVLELIRDATGLTVDLLSEEEEGRLCLLGAWHSLAGVSGDARMVDVGGGSTELVLGNPSRIDAVRSLPLGCVTITEQFLQSDPPAAEEIRAASGEVVSRLDHLHLRPCPGGPVIATGGTATSLVSVELSSPRYSPEHVHGYVLNRRRLEQLTTELAVKTTAQRKQLPGLSPTRADIIVGGAIILSNVLACWGGGAYRVSDRGLRHGIIGELLGLEGWRGALRLRSLRPRSRPFDPADGGAQGKRAGRAAEPSDSAHSDESS